jgi:Tol biopolymer transport system component/DNA-binding winged helix-turn-helix (wHTH) protein
MSDQPGILRFGVFEVHLAAGELRKNGSRVKLQEQPFQLLVMLLKRPGEIVTREELKEKLWAGDTFVDFDHSLSTAVNKIREALGDSATSPRFIETVPRKGYRFVGGASETPEVPEEAVRSRPEEGRRPKRLWLTVGAAAALLAAGGLSYWFHGLPPSTNDVEPRWNLSRITSDAGLSYQAVISPDGSLIAYASDRAGEGNLDIWVQQIGGGRPVRLTNDPADESEPAFSPDGRVIAFSSQRSEGGVYVVPTMGGDAQLIFPGGRLPRFSPDGEWIVCATRVDGYPLMGEVYLTSLDGRNRRRLTERLSHASYPTWSPDGRALLVSGILTRDTALSPIEALREWYVVPLAESDPVETGAEKILTDHKLTPIRTNQFVPAVWTADGWVYFSAAQGDSENIWKLRISPETWKAEGSPLRFTLGPGSDQMPSLSADGRVVFSSVARNVNLWSLPVEANSGKVLGEPARLTEHPGTELHPSIAPDGTRLAYTLVSGNQHSIWVQEVPSGGQRSVTPSMNGRPGRLILSKDGSRVVSAGAPESGYPLRVAPAAGGAVETLCPGTTERPWPWSWSASGRLIAQRFGADPFAFTIGVLDTETCELAEILSDPGHYLYQAEFSPDDRWIAFLGHGILVSPFDGLKIIDRSRWGTVFGSSAADKPRWAPDGNSLYFTGQPEADLVIYRQPLDARSKQPVGEPAVVHRFPSSRVSFREVNLPHRDISVAANRIVFPLAELTGNVWVMER